MGNMFLNIWKHVWLLKRVYAARRSVRGRCWIILTEMTPTNVAHSCFTFIQHWAPQMERNTTSTLNVKENSHPFFLPWIRTIPADAAAPTYYSEIPRWGMGHRSPWGLTPYPHIIPTLIQYFLPVLPHQQSQFGRWDIPEALRTAGWAICKLGSWASGCVIRQ